MGEQTELRSEQGPGQVGEQRHVSLWGIEPTSIFRLRLKLMKRITK